jgi:hypothetical protein
LSPVFARGNGTSLNVARRLLGRQCGQLAPMQK